MRDIHSHEAADTGDYDGVRAVLEEDEACFVSERDGAGGSVGRVVLAGRAALSEGGHRTPSSWDRAHAADLLPSAVVQPFRPGGRGSPVRFSAHARLCRD